MSELQITKGLLKLIYGGVIAKNAALKLNENPTLSDSINSLSFVRTFREFHAYEKLFSHYKTILSSAKENAPHFSDGLLYAKRAKIHISIYTKSAFKNVLIEAAANAFVVTKGLVYLIKAGMVDFNEEEVVGINRKRFLYRTPTKSSYKGAAYVRTLLKAGLHALSVAEEIQKQSPSDSGYDKFENEILTRYTRPRQKAHRLPVSLPSGNRQALMPLYQERVSTPAELTQANAASALPIDITHPLNIKSIRPSLSQSCLVGSRITKSKLEFFKYHAVSSARSLESSPEVPEVDTSQTEVLSPMAVSKNISHFDLSGPREADTTIQKTSRSRCCLRKTKH